MDLSRNNPSQFVDEDFLTFLQKEGYKKGGAVDIEAADARLAAAMSQRMAKGGSVDIEAADARLAQAMAQRMAEGGGTFKKLEFMADGGKIVKGIAQVGKRLLASGEEAPKVDRLSMSYKDVTKRVPEVADALEQLVRGEITKAQYNDIVNLYKPVTPYSFVPKPASKEEAIDALRGDAAKSRYGMQSEYEPGSKVGLRLDIPAYTGKGVWVNSIHNEKAKKVAYGPTASVKNADLGISQNESKRIALGGAKAPYARIKGEWNPMSEEEAIAKAQEYLNHPEWRQIGIDPERHAYFYDRATMQPITNAEEVIQIGPLVLGKNPKYANFDDFEYADGGKIVKGGLNIAKRLFGDNVLPAIEREANLAKFLEPSKAQQRLYHGTGQGDISAFKSPLSKKVPSGYMWGQKGDETYNRGVFLSPDPEMANHFAKRGTKLAEDDAGQYAVYPVRAQIEHPFDYENPKHREILAQFFQKQYDDWHKANPDTKRMPDVSMEHLLDNPNMNFQAIESPEMLHAIEKLGFDSFYTSEGKAKNIGVFDPRKIKSDIGNRGTYDINEGDMNKAEGGPAFKTLQFKEPQHFDGGGIASPEESSGYSSEPFFSSKKWSDIKKNASEMYDETKQSLASDYDRLKSSGRARAQLAKIAAAQLAGGAPDLAHLGVDFVLDPLKSVTVDKLLTKPAYRSVMEGPANPNSPRLEDQPQREPMFGSLSDSLKTSDGLPIGGSEHLIKRAQEAGLMSQGRFSPLTEIPAAIVGGLGLSKLGKVAGKGYQKHIEPRVDPAGSLSRAIDQDSNSLLPLFANNPLYAPQSVKLTGLQPEVKTASTGTPQGATYATKQDGPFYRVSPTSLDVSGAKNRGIREASELQGEGSNLGATGQAGREVPQLLSPEEVGRIIADPAANEPLKIAQRFTKETQGTDFVKPDIPESSLAKQSAIGRAQQLAVEGSPEYKSAVFDAYAKQMPDLLEQVGAKNYDDLMEKAYRQMAKETDDQFQKLPYNFSYHRAGEGNYNGAMDMASDVHGNKHLYVYQGGDPHDFLNRMDKASGLNENEKFRAVHDLLGHAIYGNQFGPRGEEMAWAVHQQMYSPLARLAMTAETRGQNSMVNYSPLNVKVKSAIAGLDELEAQALRKGDKALVNEIRAAKRQEYSNFEFAPNKAVLLPPEFVDPKFTGGLPDYLSAANRPAKGTETQSVLTHFSNDPNLQMLDPKRYGTGIKGAEAERLRDYAGGVKDRSYVYLGEPGTIAPESGLGVNRYRGESSSLYDITKDPLAFRALARESNRTPFSAKVNAGITSPLQEANDYERLVKEYGYEGMINPNASKPMGIMFNPTPVQPRKRGGLTQLRAR